MVSPVQRARLPHHRSFRQGWRRGGERQTDELPFWQQKSGGSLWVLLKGSKRNFRPARKHNIGPPCLSRLVRRRTARNLDRVSPPQWVSARYMARSLGQPREMGTNNAVLNPGAGQFFLGMSWDSATSRSFRHGASDRQLPLG